jgi:hypothetical protein
MENQDDLGYDEEGLGPDSAGQSGDTQGLSNVAEASSESVAELVEEGQFFEAEVVEGVENQPEGVTEIHTKQRRPGRRAARPAETDDPIDNEEQRMA